MLGYSPQMPTEKKLSRLLTKDCLWPSCPSCCPTNSVKALKGEKEDLRNAAKLLIWGIGVRWLTRDLANLSPTKTTRRISGQDKDGRPPSELGVSRSVECDTFS